MLDIKFIRENSDLLKKTAEQKNIAVDIDRLIDIDAKRRLLLQKVEELRREKNDMSKEIPKMGASERAVTLEKMKETDREQDGLEEKLKAVAIEFDDLMYQMPMPVDERVPVGADESGNVELYRVGEIPKFNFRTKDHIELGLDLGIINFERAAKFAGARSYILIGDGARLEAALLKYAVDFISRKNYKLMSVPIIVNKEALFGTGFFPGAEEEIYFLEKDSKYLVGTSEVSIGSYHAGEILESEALPLRYAGISTCFRREAGSYGKDTHGLYRVHQFNKIEQFIICHDRTDESREMHAELLKNSEDLLQGLQLPYRVLNICTGDMGKGKVYMNDIETWMPGRNNYGETHSCSTLHDFQARRLNLRYKDNTGKVHFCHTLNNTVIATPRILIPVFENYQNEDGSITIPEVLRPYMDNQERISKKA